MTDRERLNCSWCGVEIPRPARGRVPKYCGRSCRQRAYEARTSGAPEEAVVLDGDALQKLHDGLYELRCATEDLRTALADGADRDELAEMATDIHRMAVTLDKVR